MNTWTNDPDITGHNRTIHTGPTPDGRVDNLIISVNYQDSNDGGRLHKAINLDGHIMPLLVRVPNMRDTLAEIRQWFMDRRRYISPEVYAELNTLMARIDSLTEPTPEEAEHAQS